MAVKIRGRNAGRTAKTQDEAPAKPSKRRGSAKPKPTQRDSTAKTAPAKRRGRPRKSETAKATAPAVTRRNSTGVDPKVEAKLQKLVEKMGDRRAKAEAEHKEAINALHEAATEALDAGVSMAKVSDWSGISRQWLYKMGDFRGRSNGGEANGKSNGKSEAKSVKRPPKRQSARKSARPAKASGGSRRRVAVRSAG